jgi:hypothetical protein
VSTGGKDNDVALTAVKSALALWTAGIVICTLLVNAPALSFVLRTTGLTRVSILTLQMRDKARKAFLQFTSQCVLELQQDEDELLQVDCKLLPPPLLASQSALMSYSIASHTISDRTHGVECSCAVRHVMLLASCLASWTSRQLVSGGDVLTLAAMLLCALTDMPRPQPCVM